MYAVIQTGSRQFKVAVGQELIIDSLPGQAGDSVTFDKVLMVGGDQVKFGAPHVAGATVLATIKEQKKGDKVIIFKYKRRKNYKRTRGHRQPLTVLEVKDIQL
jgi:large subunit ribosomal protein L21